MTLRKRTGPLGTRATGVLAVEHEEVVNEPFCHPYLERAVVDRLRAKSRPVRLATQDYRCVPQTIQVAADRPCQFTIMNEGRELHEFTTRLFSDPQVIITAVEHPGGLSPTRVCTSNPGKAVKHKALVVSGKA